jgi:hypothetical protein
MPAVAQAAGPPGPRTLKQSTPQCSNFVTWLDTSGASRACSERPRDGREKNDTDCMLRRQKDMSTLRPELPGTANMITWK